jgi:hypothetical protein
MAAVADAAWKRGAEIAVVHQGTLRLMAVARHGRVIQAPAPGFGYPMSVAALDVDDAREVLTPLVAGALRAGDVVMSARSAALRSAKIGDQIVLEGWNLDLVEARVGAIVDDAEIDWVELVLPADMATRLGLLRPARLLVWGEAGPDAIANSINLELGPGPVKVTAPGDQSDEDWVLPTVLVKERFGEFSFRPEPGGGIEIDSTWLDSSIVMVDLPLVGTMRCHRLVVPYLAAALRQVEASGLARTVDYADTQLAGGCFNPRLMKGGDRGFAISRHSWGIAFDLNPSTNPFGGEVTLPTEVGELFRGFGFSWGAGFLVPDGMHFEWRQLLAELPPCVELVSDLAYRQVASLVVYARSQPCL